MWNRLLELDREWLVRLNGWGGLGWDRFWTVLSDKWTALPLYILLVVLVFRWIGWKRTFLLLVFVGLLILSTDQLSNLFKYGVQRLRPCHDPELEGLLRLVKSSCGGRFGFFSAHAANAFGLAVFFTAIWRRRFAVGMTFLIFWGLLVGYSRVYLGVHYPLDVLTGFLVGGVFGWLFSRMFILALQKLPKV